MPTTTEELREQEQQSAKRMKLDIAAKCVLRWAKLTDQAYEPVRGSARAAGVDLRSAYDVIVPARGKALVKTDLQVQVPEGSYGRIAPRSGLAVKNFIDVGAGVVDEDYRGNLGVVLFNHADDEFQVKRGDRIAQFICERIFYPVLEQADKLEETQRGEAGFGSTGMQDVASKNGNKNGAEAKEKASDKADKEEKKDNADKTVKTDKAEKESAKAEKAEKEKASPKSDKTEKKGDTNEAPTAKATA